MNSLTIVLMIIAGGLLIYASVKGIDPRDLAKKALTQGSPNMVGKAGSAVTDVVKATGAAGSAALRG